MKHSLFHNVGDGSATLFNFASSSNPQLGPGELPVLVHRAAQRGWQVFPVLVLSKYSTQVAEMISQATSDLDNRKHGPASILAATGP
jgi:hypothetical protein